MKKLVVPIVILLCAGIVGCVPTTNKAPPPTALETRQIQTRNFQVRDERLVMKAVLNALQDDGYITKNAVTELGLLTATKEVDTQDTTTVIINSILMGDRASWQKNAVIEANANVTSFGKEIRLRISFQRKMFDNFGRVMHVESISDPIFYQQFFTKVDQSIFIQKERI